MAHKQSGGVVVSRMMTGRGNFGFDAGRKEYVDLVEAGIIDPTKVVRVALENAVSVASTFAHRSHHDRNSGDPERSAAGAGNGAIAWRLRLHRRSQL